MSSRFQPFAPSSLRTSGLRRLKTAFSPSSSASSNRSFRWSSGASTPHRSPSSASVNTGSPLSSHMGSPDMGDCETMEGLVLVNTAFSMEGSPDLSYRKPSQKAPVSGSRNRLRAMLMRRRRQQSSWDLRIEEEQKTFGTAIRVFEPRHKGEISMGGIFEVMEGKY
jgi:hypothetical protein